MTEKEQIADLIRKAHEAFYADYEPGRMYSEFVAEYLMENEKLDRHTMTNADSIRAMSDEELANIICCPVNGDSNLCLDTWDCIACTLDWLKQPVGDNNG